MGIVAKPTHYEMLISRLNNPPVIVNDLNLDYVEDVAKRDRLLLTQYEDTTFSLEPMCECRHLRGGDKRGRICPKCNTEVLPHTERRIQSELIIRVPDSVPAFINPICFAILTSAFSTRQVDVMRWLIDRTYTGQFQNIPILEYLKSKGIERGLNYFVKNFEYIIDSLLTSKLYQRSDERNEIPAFIDVVGEDMFTQYLPVPNKIAFVTERSATGRYADKDSTTTAIEAVNAITSLKTRFNKVTPTIEENVAAKVVLALSGFYLLQIKNAHSQKNGWWRKHIFGTRMPFSGRAVITSLTEVHDYDEVHMPWGLAIVIMRFHIENKLYRRGFTPNKAKGFISRCVRQWDPLMREILDELIEESPHTTSTSGKRGVPMLLNRNPSLLYGSIQQFYITKVKDRVEDISISYSVLTLGPMNADLNKVHHLLIAGNPKAVSYHSTHENDVDTHGVMLPMGRVKTLTDTSWSETRWAIDAAKRLNQRWHGVCSETIPGVGVGCKTRNGDGVF